MIAFIQHLRQHHAEEDSYHILSALQQDNLVWHSLKDCTFQARAKEIIGKDFSKWSPAQLGLIALNSPTNLESLVHIPLESIHDTLRDRAFNTLSSFLTEPDEFEFNLENATLIALALREDYIDNQSWDKLVEVGIESGKQYGASIISILFGMLPDPEEMLKTLVTSKRDDSLGLAALHTILSNPLSPAYQGDLLSRLLNPLSAQQQVNILRPLSGQRERLAKNVAQQLVKQAKGPSRKASNLRQRAKVHQVGGQYAEALQALQQAWNTAQGNQFDAIVELASDAAHNKSRDIAQAALEQAQEFAKENEISDARLQIVRLELGENNVNPSINVNDISLAEGEESPTALILAAQIAVNKGLTENASAFSRNALDRLNHQTIAPHYLQRLAELLLSLKLPHEAIKAAELGLRDLSNNSSFLFILSRAQHMARQLEEAAQNAYAAATQDDDPAIQRHLIDVLMDIEFWDAAQVELHRLIKQQSKPEAKDLCNLADCALQLQQPEKAAQAGQQAIQLYPDNGYAHSLLGRALIELGNPQNASEHLRKATQLSPEVASAWLALAEYYTVNHESAKAQNTLQSGVEAAPNAVELHYALGQSYLNAGTEEKALNAFEEASKLLEVIGHETNPLSKSIVLDLGNTLLALGQSRKALSTFNKAFQNYPSDNDIATAYAGMLMQESEYRNALEVLAVILEQDPENLEANLNLARAHMALKEEAEASIRALQIVRATASDNDEAILLLAEAYKLNGDTQAAFDCYNEVLDSLITIDSQWRTRVQLGLAEVALDMDTPDVAIATLQDAQLANPGDTGILKALANAYQAADLPHESFQTAREAYSKSSNDLDIVLWFAEQATLHEEPAEAGEALKRAVELQPDEPETLLKLGQTQLQLGAEIEAKVSFRKLLDSQQVSSNTLFAAAKSVGKLDSPEASLDFLERAREIDDKPEPDLLKALFTTYQQTGAAEKALMAIEGLLVLEPENADVLANKASILMELDRSSAALACLEHALQIAPAHAKLHYQAAQIFRSMSELLKALDHAEQALSLAPEDAEIRFLAAETALSCLRSERAARILEIVVEKPESFSQNGQLLDLAGSVLLDKDDSDQAESLLSLKQDTDLETTTLAIKAKLAFTQHDLILGKQLLEKAAQALTEHPNEHAAKEVAKAAISGRDWDFALQILQQQIKQNGEEPFLHLLLATSLLDRAYFAQHCDIAKSNHGNQLAEWTGEEVWNQFEQAINQAKAKAPFEDTHHNILHLYARGVDMFAPGKHEPKVASYPSSAIEVATALNNLKGDIDLDTARQMAQKHPKDGYVLMALANLLESENLAKAFESASRAVEIQPANPVLNAFAARLAHAVEDFEIALQYIDTALSVWEDEADWHSLAGHINTALHEDSAAIQHFQLAHELDPQNAEVLFRLGQVNMSQGKNDAAIQAFERSIQIDQNQPDVLLALGHAQHKSKKLMLAAKNIEKAIKQQPQNPEALFMRARIAQQSGDTQNAIKFADAALKIDASQSDYHLLKADVLRSQNQVDKAIAQLELAASSSKNILPLQLSRAQLLEQNGDVQASLTLLKELALDEPNEPEILISLSLVLEKAGRTQDAIQAAQQAVRHSLTLPNEQQAELRHHLGRLLEGAGQLDQAIEHLGEAINLNPNKAEPHVELACAYKLRRQYPQALEHFQQAIALAPQDPRAYWESAQILKDSKDYEGAETMLRHAAGLAPDDVNVQRQLAAVVALNLVHPTNANEVAIQA